MAMVIDASVWVAAFLPRDAHHAQSAALLREIVAAGHEADAPALMLAEVAGAIARQTHDAELAETVIAFIASQTWLNFTALTLDSAQAASAAAAQQRLRGADAVYVALAHELNTDLITLDREMASRSASLVNCMSPKSWIALRQAAE